MKAAGRILCAVAIAAVLGSCSLFDYSSMVTRRFALVYGISKYSASGQPGNPNLTYPDADASAVDALLGSKGYTVVQSRWVDALGNVTWNASLSGVVGTPTNDGVGNVTEPGLTSTEAPTKAAIISDIQSLASVVGPNDLVLVYFSGHGMMDTPTPPSTHQYIVPYEGVQWFAGPPGAYYGVPAYSIRDDELRGYLDALPTNRKVVVLDTCNSGGFIGNTVESDALGPIYAGNAGITAAVISAAISNYLSFTASPTGLSPGTATVISAAGRDESSYESGSPFSHGIMTYYLLQIGQNGDLNHDGHVTVSEAYSLIKAGIDKQWNADAGVIAAQETFAPHISGGPMDFVLF